MAEEKKSFVGYVDWGYTFEMLEDDEAGKLIKHFFKYIKDEDPELEDKLLKIAFNPIKLQLKRDLSKWDITKERRSIAGKASAEAKKIQKEVSIKSTKSTSVEFVEIESTNSTVNDTVTVTVNVNDTVTVNDILLEKETKKEFKEIPLSKNEIYGKELLEGESWVETISMQNRIKPEEVPKWIDSFSKKLISELDNKISKKEYASHFSRWLPQEILKSKKITGNGNTAPTRNR